MIRRRCKMIKIAIVDDEERFRDMMENYLKRYAQQKGKEMAVTCFADAFDFLDTSGQGWVMT